MVSTCTPLRVSFAGGGTDLPEFYGRHEQGGAVVSTAIDHYLYVTVKDHDPLFGEGYRLNYSVTEHANQISEIKNDIARECLQFIGINEPLYVGVIADLPSSSGLGSSSSFAVGLLNALHTYLGHRVSAGQLAEEAAHVERNILERPIGKQDHYAAAFGSMNYFQFQSNERVAIEPCQPVTEQLEDLFEHLMMFWTNQQRNAASILSEMQSQMTERWKLLCQIREMADVFHGEVIGDCRIPVLAEILSENWSVKRKLAGSISNSNIDYWYDCALDAGALGGKLCGAGGGGFLLFLVEPDRRNEVRQRLDQLIEVPIHLDPYGSRIMSSM